MVTTSVSVGAAGLVAPLVFAALLTAAFETRAQAYRFSTLPPVSADRNTGHAINDRGDVVGTSGPGVNTWGFSATIWQGGMPSPLGQSPVAPYPGSTAFAINNTGLSGGADALSNAILWNGLAPTVLPSLPGGRAAVFGLNDQGQAVGWSTRRDANGNPTLGFATLWNEGAAVDLGSLGGDSSQARDINAGGLIAGWSKLADNFTEHATLWQNGQPIDLGTAGGASSWANAVNDNGMVAGHSTTDEDGTWRAVVWQEGVPTVLGMIGDDWTASFARGINNAGQVVGLSGPPQGGFSHATLWSDGAAIDLNSFLSASDTAAGWHLLEANGINNLGSITGTAYNRLSFRYAAYVLAIPAIPEPASASLMGLGLAVLWAARRARHRMGTSPSTSTSTATGASPCT
jgi:probable HAF family extracellular repeat protein